MSKMSDIAEQLANGETVRTRLSGNSMSPRIKSRELVTVTPCKIDDLKVNDVAFVKVRGAYYLHLVKQVGDDGRVLIGNNQGRINGWTRQVYGKLTEG